MRTVGSKADTTWPALREAGLRLLYERGFAGMNLRDLAKETGLTPGSLYNYFESKEGFLFRLIETSTNEIYADVSSKVKRAKCPIDKLDIFIEAHIEWYTLRREEIFIGSSEMRSLSVENRAAFIALRKRYERLATDIIDQGMKEGVFAPIDSKVATFSILSMLSGLSTWYRPNGRVGLPDLIKMHKDYVHRILHVNQMNIVA